MTDPMCLICKHDHKCKPQADGSVWVSNACLEWIPWAPRLTEGGDFPSIGPRSEDGKRWMRCDCSDRIDIEIAGCEKHGPPPDRHQRYLPCLDCATEAVELASKLAACDAELRPLTDAYLAACREVHARHGVTDEMLESRREWDDE